MFKKNLIESCIDEWEFFQRGKQTEIDAPQYLRVKDYWDTVIPNNQRNGRTTEPDATGKLIRPPWSAAFISFVMKVSGAGSRFNYSGAHCHYAQASVSETERPKPNRLYSAMNPKTYSPKVGDLIHAGRSYAKQFTYKNARSFYLSKGYYPSHSDVVIEVNRDKGYIYAIGGNTKDSFTRRKDTVGRKRFAIDERGRLLPHSGRKQLPWIMVLRCEDQ